MYSAGMATMIEDLEDRELIHRYQEANMKFLAFDEQVRGVEKRASNLIHLRCPVDDEDDGECERCEDEEWLHVARDELVTAEGKRDALAWLFGHVEDVAPVTKRPNQGVAPTTADIRAEMSAAMPDAERAYDGDEAPECARASAVVWILKWELERRGVAVS